MRRMAGTGPTWSLEYARDGNARTTSHTALESRSISHRFPEGAAMDPKHFRQVLGQYPTGVVIVTSVSAQGEALGMTVGSFTSVSLDPPLVAFLPDKPPSSWLALR